MILFMAASPTPIAAPTQSGEFATVFAFLKPQMASLDRFLEAQLDQFEPEIRDMADYCIDTSGKRIRPALVFLSGWSGQGELPDDLVKVAAVVELVHLATLVHDDIMDGAELRRGRRTATREFGSEASVLLGDALFSHALALATQFPTTEVCRAVAESMRRVCAGEIVQTLRRGTTNITRADYRRIVDLKTAELFRVSCDLGARLGGFSAAYADAAARFGRHLGIGYQIYDDLVDFSGDERRIGKTLGTDLASGKLTLPLLVLLERLPEPERAQLVAELTGKSPADIGRCLRQMQAYSIFPAVAEEVVAEIVAAETALAPFLTNPAAVRLRLLSGVLRDQLGALRLPLAGE